MIEALSSFLGFLVVVVVVAAIILWAVGRFFPELATPARYVIGAITIIVILYLVLQLVRGTPGLP